MSKNIKGCRCHECRPLAVIDPESVRDVDRLAALMPWALHSGDVPRLAAALREYAAPTPSKPAEPTGLGAVVKDVQGARWVRWTNNHRADRNWRREGGPVEYQAYADILAVRVLSEGVTS